MDRLHLVGSGMNMNPNLREINLSRQHAYRRGRNEDQEIRIMDSMISRQHANIQYSDQSWHIVDKRSLNGTFVNGRELTPFQSVPLQHGDVIQLGIVVEEDGRDYKFKLAINQHGNSPKCLMQTEHKKDAPPCIEEIVISDEEDNCGRDNKRLKMN